MNHANVHSDVTAELTLGGVSDHIEAMTLSDLRREIIQRAAAHASATGAPVALTIDDIDAVATLSVHPDGKVEETAPRQPHGATPAASEPVPSEQAASSQVAQESAPQPTTSEPAPAESPIDSDTIQRSDLRPAAEEPAGRAPISSVPRASELSPVSNPRAESVPTESAPADESGSDAWNLQSDASPEIPAESQPAPPRPSWTPGTTDWNRPPQQPNAQQQPAQPAPQQPAQQQPQQPQQQPVRPQEPQRVQAQQPPHPTVPSAAPAPNADTAAAVRKSFLVQETSEEPAKRGVRGGLTRMGMRVAPSAAERAERADEQAVSQHWPGPRTIAVVNGKGGAGKTPTTILLSAVLARYGGAGVLAWDNNQTRGTLGWRTEQGPHESTLLDLLPNVPRLLGTGAQSADLASFVHHQTRDRFDVLRSKPMALAAAQRISGDDVDAIHAVASKYYRLVVIDSGNDESDPLWLRMIDHADQIVVATTTRDDHAEAGALLLDALRERDERSARLAANAVAVVNQADPKGSKQDLQRVADGYRELTREVVAVPHDPEMVDGVLRLGALQSATQRAWLAAGAAVARGL